jgi:hypothetical protein
VRLDGTVGVGYDHGDKAILKAVRTCDSFSSLLEANDAPAAVISSSNRGADLG